jgi:hypothetical protein
MKNVKKICCLVIDALAMVGFGLLAYAGIMQIVALFPALINIGSVSGSGIIGMAMELLDFILALVIALVGIVNAIKALVFLIKSFKADFSDFESDKLFVKYVHSLMKIFITGAVITGAMFVFEVLIVMMSSSSPNPSTLINAMIEMAQAVAPLFIVALVASIVLSIGKGGNKDDKPTKPVAVAIGVVFAIIALFLGKGLISSLAQWIFVVVAALTAAYQFLPAAKKETAKEPESEELIVE